MRAAWFLAIAWLLLIPACSTKSALAGPAPEPAPVIPPAPSITYAKLETLGGFVHWECDVKAPMAFVRIYVRGEPIVTVDTVGITVSGEFVEYLGHEMRHVSQANAMGCDLFRAAFDNPDSRAVLERDAECYGYWLAYKIRCED